MTALRLIGWSITAVFVSLAVWTSVYAAMFLYAMIDAITR